VEQYEEVVPGFIVKKLVEKLVREKRSRQMGKCYVLVLWILVFIITSVLLLTLFSQNVVGSLEPRVYQINPFK